MGNQQYFTSQPLSAKQCALCGPPLTPKKKRGQLLSSMPRTLTSGLPTSLAGMCQGAPPLMTPEQSISSRLLTTLRNYQEQQRVGKGRVLYINLCPRPVPSLRPQSLLIYLAQSALMILSRGRVNKQTNKLAFWDLDKSIQQYRCDISCGTVINKCDRWCPFGDLD